MRSTRLCLPLILALLAGCAAPAPVGGAIAGNWVIDRQGAPAPAPVPAVVPAEPAALAAPPADPAFAAVAEALGMPEALAPAPVRRGGGGSSGGGAAVAATSQLTIDLRGFLGALAPVRARRLLATVDDVAKVLVTVYQPGQPEKVITVTKAQIAAGVAEVTFPELALGNAIVFAVAYDAADIPIGSAAQVAVVRADGAAMADLPMQLVPSGGAGAGTGGTLVTRTTLLDGPVADPPSGTVLTEVRANWGVQADLEPGPDGEMYVGGYLPPGSAVAQQLNGKIIGGYVRLAPDGSALFNAGYGSPRYPLRMQADGAGGLYTWPLGRHIDEAALVGKPATNNVITLGSALTYVAAGTTVGPDGDLFYTNISEPDRLIHRMTRTGAETTTTMAGYSALAFDPAGNLWTNVASVPGDALAQPGEAVRKYGPTGALLGTYTTPGPVEGLWPAPDGSVWIAHGASGARLTPKNAAPFNAAWEFPGFTTQLCHMAADGTILGTHAVATRDVAIDEAGNAWVAGPVLKKLSPTGVELGSWAFDSYQVTRATDGMIWVAGGLSLVRRIQP